MAVPRCVGLWALALCSLSASAASAEAQREAEDRTSVTAATEAHGEAAADEVDDDDLGPAANAKRRWRVELKRQSTARGTPSESTKTSLKIETFPDGPIRLLRLELPFPDDKTSFSGSPFNPRLGDIKTRLGLKAAPVYGIPLAPFLELTFPTANPQTLGSGKYQVTVGIETSRPLRSIDNGASMHQFSLAGLVQQVVSVAGDQSAKDINYTKFELGIGDVWRQGYSIKLTLKPVIDWQQDGKTGAVAELEGGLNLSPGWRLSLMLGGQLWGTGVPSTYSKRVELKLRHDF